MARLLARALRSLGVLKRGHLVEVQRGDLVAGHVGQTAIRTREAVERAKGGVLFVDECYRLSRGAANDFGPEAIDELMAAMEAGAPVHHLRRVQRRRDGRLRRVEPGPLPPHPAHVRLRAGSTAAARR